MDALSAFSLRAASATAPARSLKAHQCDRAHPPRERMQVELPIEETARSHAPKLSGPRVRTFRRFSAIAIDSLMCTSMNVMQSRHRLHARSRDEFENYVSECEKLTTHDFYAVPR